jgi:hypothetical protein
LKIILPLIFIVLTAACRKEVSGWDKLSPEEQDYLRTRSRTTCLSSASANFNKFKELSDNNFNSFAESKTWKIETKQKEEATETLIDTSYLSVWKKDTNALYFVWTNNKTSPASVKFIKVTDAQNEEMITDLLWKKCALRDTYVITDYPSKLDVTLVGQKTNQTASSYDLVGYDYVLNYEILPLLGSFQEKKVVKSYKSDGTLTKTVSYTVTFSTTSDAILKESYTEYANSQFCMNESDTPTLPNTEREYRFPFNSTTSLKCVNEASTSIDADGNGTADFRPSIEL